MICQRVKNEAVERASNRESIIAIQCAEQRIITERASWLVGAACAELNRVRYHIVPTERFRPRHRLKSIYRFGHVR